MSPVFDLHIHGVNDAHQKQQHRRRETVSTLSAFLLDSRNSSKSSVTNFLCCAAFLSSPSFEHNNIFALHSLTDHSKASVTTSWVL